MAFGPGKIIPIWILDQNLVRVDDQTSPPIIGGPTRSSSDVVRHRRLIILSCGRCPTSGFDGARKSKFRTEDERRLNDDGTSTREVFPSSPLDDGADRSLLTPSVKSQGLGKIKKCRCRGINFVRGSPSRTSNPSENFDSAQDFHTQIFPHFSKLKPSVAPDCRVLHTS